MKKLIAMILASACVVACATSCGGESSATNSSSSSSSSGSVQNGVYKPATLTSNGEEIGSYKIVKSSQASECESYAAEELRDYIYEGTGVTLPIITDEATKSSNEVVIGQTNRDICKGVDYTLLGEEGYTLKTNGKDLLIGANETRGVLYGVYTYLEKLGYRFYTKEVENIPSSRKVFIAKDLEETYVPRLEYRDILYEAAYGGEIAPKLKINTAFCQYDLQNEEKYGGCVGYVYDELGFCHTMRLLVNETYLSSNPEYFALWKGKRVAGQWTGGYCFSCEELVELTANTAITWIKADPQRQMISITQNDTEIYCECSLCSENYKQYGKSGTLLNFVNAVAERIGAVYPEVKVEMLPYWWAEEVPKGGVVPADNVSIRLCMPHCNIKQHQEEGCQIISENQARYDGWASIANDMLIYMYRSDWNDWHSVLPNIYSIYDEIKFFTQSKVVTGLYHEGYMSKSVEFGELRNYIAAKLMWNPDMSKEEFFYHVDDFLEGYYGDGWKYIKAYIEYTEDVASEYATKKLKDYNSSSGDMWSTYRKYHRFMGDDYTFFSTDINDLTTMLNRWNELWDKAEADADMQQLERVKVSRVAPKFFELSYTMDYRYKMGTDEEKAELVAQNEALYQTIIKYGLTEKAEGKFIRTDVSDFTKSPNTWVYKN